MGQKVNPISFRSRLNLEWGSSWYNDSNVLYSFYVNQDFAIRSFVFRTLRDALISDVRIERLSVKALKIYIYAAKTSYILGKNGNGVEDLKKKLIILLKSSHFSKDVRLILSDKVKVDELDISIDVVNVKKFEADANVVASSIAKKIESRASYKRAMKEAISSSMKSGVIGIKVAVSGRLNGAEIARSEWLKDGQISLHTLKSNISYGCASAHTTYGVIGIKVWIVRRHNF